MTSSLLLNLSILSSLPDTSVTSLRLSLSGGNEDKIMTSRKRNRDGNPSAGCNVEIPISASFCGLPSQPFSRRGIMTAGNLVTHVITVYPGEDIIAKAATIVQTTGQDIYIVSAAGSVSHASISVSGCTTTYEGLYEIVSLTGYLFPAMMRGDYGRNNMVCCLACVDGSVFGGSVPDSFIAAGKVQVFLWSFTHSPITRVTPVGSCEN